MLCCELFSVKRSTVKSSTVEKAIGVSPIGITLVGSRARGDVSADMYSGTVNVAAESTVSSVVLARNLSTAAAGSTSRKDNIPSRLGELNISSISNGSILLDRFAMIHRDHMYELMQSRINPPGRSEPLSEFREQRRQPPCSLPMPYIWSPLQARTFFLLMP